MVPVFVLVFCLFQAVIGKDNTIKTTNILDCPQGDEHVSTLTAYFPGELEEDSTDVKGNNLQSLQDFLDGRADYVTVAVDANLGLRYGTKLCIPYLNHHFGQAIIFEVRDTNPDFKGLGFSRLEICVRSEPDSYDKAVNRDATIVVLKNNF